MFEGKCGPMAVNECGKSECPYGGIGRLKMEQDWLKKVWAEPVEARRAGVVPEATMPVIRQRQLGFGVACGGACPRVPRLEDDLELKLLGSIDEQYMRRPVYGSWKMVRFLKGQCHRVNRKRVQRLMRILGLAGRAPGPNTSRPHLSVLTNGSTVACTVIAALRYIYALPRTSKPA